MKENISHAILSPNPKLMFHPNATQTQEADVTLQTSHLATSWSPHADLNTRYPLGLGNGLSTDELGRQTALQVHHGGLGKQAEELLTSTAF